MFYRKYGKRLFDVTGSSILLILLLPVVLIVTLICFFSNGKQPFFFQKRPGKSEKIFNILKFRTMNNGTDAQGNLLPDELRITSTGRWIRRLSLDEILQLVNVLKGDMSLVGPRPLLTDYLSLYTERQRRRHTVLPGITGWAQIHGRNNISWQERFELDIWYVEHYSFLLDLKILFITFKNIFSFNRRSATGHNIMPHFKGEK